ncbi:MAG: YfhO family protein [Gemmatimonadota bacterium]
MWFIGSDYLAGAYFAHEFISERFAAGALPKWVPYLYGGLPMFANPGSAFYPFRFLADLVFPVAKIFPALYVIQFGMAGLGGYLLARELGARRWIAFLTGLAFQFTGLMMSFVLAGHDGRIIVATFAPLVFFFILALAFGLAAVNFLPFSDYVDASPRGGPGRGYDYATSWSMPPGELTGVVLPEQAGLLENYRGDNPFKLHTEYVGAVVMLLFLVGLWACRRDPYWWFFAGLSVFALTIAFGGYTPLYRLYYAILPGTARFRAPSISFFLVSMSLVVMAGLALQRLAALRDARDDERATADLAPVPWILAGGSALALLVLLAVAGGASDDARGVDLARGAFRIAVVTWLAAGALLLWLRRSIGTRLVLAALAILVVGDLWIVDRRFFETVPPPQAMFAPDGVVETLEAEPGVFRVWVLPIGAGGNQPYRNHTNYLMHFDIEQAGGEHGNHIQRWGEFVGAGEATYVDWHNFLADLQGLVEQPGQTRANFLAAANVRYIVSTALLPGLREVYRGSEALVYEVPSALPRAWLASEVELAPTPDGALERFRDPAFDPSTTALVYQALPDPPPAGPLEGEARILEHAPDRVRIEAEASRRALLVLADNHYDGWEATVDGQPAPVHRVNHTFRGVVVPAGTHEVVFEFRPEGVYAGLTISLLAALAILAALLIPAVLRRRGRA